ncbi:MAG: DUF4450 domain-containing protein, partial [Chthoniobacter sp.]|nr:DUF4450 domain-containing protein [Chthoniobacter sp.]
MSLLPVLALALAAAAQPAADSPRPELTFQPHGNFSNNVARPLRYWPVAGDFVITNGSEFFNRPLYSLNSGFRVDGGDRPEFSLYLPGRGGNLRLGLKSPAGTNWLNAAAQIVARYRPGSLIYEIEDPLLGGAALKLTVLPLCTAKGVIMSVETSAGRAGADPAELVFAFGGASGTRGVRDGDIGCERQPVAEFFQLRPEQCLGHVFSFTNHSFILRHKQTVLAGTVPPDTQLFLAEATNWNTPAALFAGGSKTAEFPVLAGETALSPARPVFFVIQQLPDDTSGAVPDGAAADPQALFAAAEQHRRDLAGRVCVTTPDPFVDAAAAALCVAADAVWDEKQQCFMHGAVAWRTRLLGWRGPYAGDTLGWHERTAAHFAGFARQQNTEPIPAVLPPPDESANLARSEAALHSNGNLSKNHYDMNLLAVDAFFRHLLWTGDTNYARALWPVIERHFAWERRLFRREFGPEHLPLYEAYAAVWASDDLSYNGGGTAHASACNYFANTQAVRVAALLGRDPAPYQQEADLILRAMNQYLWLPDQGSFAESKDWLGGQQVHPNAGLWTFYHTLDSGVPAPAQSGRMADWIQTHLAHIPITGRQVPDEGLFTLPETAWLPYQWSLNNVVMAEAAHTSLGFWQAGRPETAFALFKGELLDSMFLGLCPGNLGCLTPHDMARGEAQRDFADAVGANARALVEGLFGVKPDALAGTLRIVPGFPRSWNFARMHHPDFDFEFVRTGAAGSGREVYSVTSKFPRPMGLDLCVEARGDSPSVSVNGRTASWHWVKNPDGHPKIEVVCPAAGQFEIAIAWRGALPPAVVPPAAVAATEPKLGAPFDWHRKIPAPAKLEAVSLTPLFNDRVTQIFRNDYRSPRSPFASLAT